MALRLIYLPMVLFSTLWAVYNVSISPSKIWALISPTLEGWKAESALSLIKLKLQAGAQVPQALHGLDQIVKLILQPKILQVYLKANHIVYIHT